MSATEAHSHDHDQHGEMSYEDLYGQPAPEIEDGDVSAEELKESFKEAAENIEQMEAPNENEQIPAEEENNTWSALDISNQILPFTSILWNMF